MNENSENLDSLLDIAEQGHAGAQGKLGIMYYNGKGVAQDFTQAATWYRKAVDQGLTVAQNNLGMLYENGEGVAQNFTQVATWCSKAAEQGHTKAQTFLGALYVTGEFVTKNFPLRLCLVFTSSYRR